MRCDVNIFCFSEVLAHVTVTLPSLDKMGGWKEVFTKLKILMKSSAHKENYGYNGNLVSKGISIL